MIFSPLVPAISDLHMYLKPDRAFSFFSLAFGLGCSSFCSVSFSTDATDCGSLWGCGSLWAEEGMKECGHDRSDYRTKLLRDTEIVITKHKAWEIFC